MFFVDTSAISAAFCISVMMVVVTVLALDSTIEQSDGSEEE